MENNMKNDIIVRVLFVALVEPAPTFLSLPFTFHVIFFLISINYPSLERVKGRGTLRW
jgi:hypothetical protein